MIGRGFLAGWVLTCALAAVAATAASCKKICPPTRAQVSGVTITASGACGSYRNGVATCVFDGIMYTCVDPDVSVSCSTVVCAPVQPQAACPMTAEAPAR